MNEVGGPAWAEMFRSHGLRFHVDPYSSIAYYPYEYSEAERRFLEPWIWENRLAGLDVAKPDVPVVDRGRGLSQFGGQARSVVAG